MERGLSSTGDRWNNDQLVSQLRQVKGSDFEVIRMEGLKTPADFP